MVREILGNVSDMTIWRWLNDEHYKDLNFPKPINIANRRYWKRSWIESFIKQREVSDMNKDKFECPECGPSESENTFQPDWIEKNSGIVVINPDGESK